LHGFHHQCKLYTKLCSNQLLYRKCKEKRGYRERETHTHTQTYTQQEGEPGGKKNFPMRSPSNNKKHFLLLWLTCHASAPNMTKASKYKIYTRYQIRKLTTVRTYIYIYIYIHIYLLHTYQNLPSDRTNHDLISD
jgi:hypothetical protein